MAAYAALVSLTNTIHQIMNHPHISTFFDTKHIQPLLEKAVLLLDFIEANNYAAGSIETEDLEREIAFAAQEAEGVLDFHIMDQIHAKSSEQGLTCPLELQQRTQDMDAVVRKAIEFKGNQGLGENQEQPPPAMQNGETPVVGLDAELYHLLHELTGEPHSSLRTISIVGMGGTGKTTLSKNIYEHELVKEHFDFRAWATISHKHSALEILSQLVYGRIVVLNENSITDLGIELRNFLCGRRYLILLDDIRSVEALDEVECFFPDNKNGSRIVLTTKQLKVSNDCESTPFMMRLLDEDRSWKLFCEKVFKNEACPAELWEVGKLIVKSCKGLVLSIVVMGGLLSKSPRTVEYWKSVAKEMKSFSEKQESLDVLNLCYRHLPSHLKPCFLYMGTFKEGSEIIVSSVVRLWIAEGFIKPNENQVLEEIGEGIIEDLIDRNLILVGRRRKNGKIASCGIHDLLRDLCIKVGKQDKFFHATDYHCRRGTNRRLICESLRRGEYQIPLARSIRTEYLCGKLTKQGLLKVLVIGSHMKSPAELHGNVNLRYLAFCKSYDVSELPASVSSLWNLHTLIILDCLVDLVVAPSEFWKMRQLRHVECGWIFLPQCNGQDHLENLQTLKRAVNLRMSKEVCKSIPNIRKLYLCYDDELQGYDDCWVEYLCNLECLNKLESLKLECFTKLTISGPKLALPSSLNKLSLSFCHLDSDDLRVIGSLPQLEVLILGPNSVSEGVQWSCIDGQFLRLKFLQIECCPIQKWVADHSHFPALEKLVLSSLNYLKEIPLGIGDIPTLELIHVAYCTVSAAISAVKIKEDQLHNGNHTIQIQVSIYENLLEDLKKRAELEGLSISNIELEMH